MKKCIEKMSRRFQVPLQAGLVTLASLFALSSVTPALAQTPATPTGGFQGIWAEADAGLGGFPNKYGGGLATYPQQISPLAIYSAEADKTFFTFSYDLDTGPGRNIGHAISYYDHATGLVARPQVWIDKQTSDPHDAPVLSIDDDGYLYMFSMTHGETRRSYISKSANPYDISSFRDDLLTSSSSTDMDVFGNPASNPGQSGNPRYSYGNAWYVPNADEDEKFLLLHTRYLAGQRDLFTTSSVDGDTWTSRKTFAQIESGQYQASWIKPDGETVGTIFNIHPTGQGLDWRSDLYYLETSDQAQTWQTADGLTLVDNSGSNNNPLTSRPDGPGNGAALVYDAAPGERVYLKDINYDAAGNPVIMFLTSPTHIPGDFGAPGPDRFVKTANWTGTEWSVKDFTTTNNNYDYGSLYVEDDGTWRVIAPFIDGPQQYGTGGEMGMWTSADQGTNWNLEKQLTNGSFLNSTYARRPLNAQEDFYAFWADGDAWEPSDVRLYFTNKNGDVFQLPYEMDSDFAAPQPFVPTPSSPSTAITGFLVSSADSTIVSLTVTRNGTARTYDYDQLIGGTLTAFGGKIVGGGHIADIITPPGSSSAPSSADRANLLSDALADTGFVNLSSWDVTFADGIMNREGPDIILLDWGSSDTVDITINGITLDDVVPTSTAVFGSPTSGRVRFLSDQTSVNTLAELLSATFQQGPTTSGASTAYAIDLSDFGFSEGEYLLAGGLVSFTDGQGIDPMGIFGLPTPGDFDLDGDVDGSDFLAWQRGLGGTSSDLDLADWENRYGASDPSALLAAQETVPEPDTILLVSLSLLLVMSSFTRLNYSR